MNKEEFLNTLRKRLNILEDSEIDDIISEYGGYIDEKVAEGLTEEKAVKELGDMDEIVKDLLAAYKLKPEVKEDWFTRFCNKVSELIDRFMSSLDNKSAKDIVRILIEVIIILFCIWILKIPFAIIRDIGESILEEIYHPIGNILGSIWWILIEVSYLIVAIIFFFKMFEKRYFENVSTKIVDEVQDEIKEEKKKEKSKKDSKVKVVKEKPIPEVKSEPRVIVKKSSFVDTLTDICMSILKFFMVIFLIGVIFYLLGMAISIGFVIYFLIRGVKYFGVLILLIGLFNAGAFILKVGIHFITNKKMKAPAILGEIIGAIVVIGIGVSMTAVEVASTDIIYIDNAPKENVKETTYTIPMKEDLVLYNYTKMVEDNSLEDTIKIVYRYPNFKNLEYEIKLEPRKSGYYLYYDVKKFRWSKDLMNKLIEDLKKKEIYVHEFEVERLIYASRENIAKLKHNR